MACNVSVYYATAAWVTVNATGNELLSLIQDRISSPHTAIPYTSSSSTDVWDALTYLDADPDKQGYVVEIYSDKSTPEDNNVDSDGWNREHVFPKSYGVGYSGSDYTDLHSLRAASWRVNSARGNKPFGECSPFTDSTCTSPAHTDAANDTAANPSLFQPPASVRGDLARSLFYMAARYNGEDSNTEDLVLSACPETLAYAMGNLTILRQWHIDDPVDDREVWRTDAVCRHYQGNRNPFIDFPDLVEKVWGNYSDYVCHTDYSALNPTSLPSEVPSISPTTEAELNTEPCLLITGIVDGDTSGGLPKAIELVVTCRDGISQLSDYGMGNANNGGGSDGEEYSFSSSSNRIAQNDFIYIAYESSTYPNSFQNYFNFAPNFTSSVVNINGDDAIELYFRGQVVDVYGNVSDATSGTWGYTDGWAYRKSNVSGYSTTQSTTWLSREWVVNPGYLSGFNTNIEAGSLKFPVKSYVVSYDPTPSPTQYPTMIPSSVPTNISIIPLSPSANPTSSPTTSLIKVPTSTPTSSPTTNPIIVPTDVITINPTSAPITLSPNPTSQPSVVPTWVDSVSLTATFDLMATSIPTSKDTSKLKLTLIEALNISDTSLRNYQLTYSTATRKLMSSTYIWTSSFNAIVSLSTISSRDQYSIQMTNILSSSAFQLQVSSNVNATIDVSTIVVTWITMSPTEIPVVQGDDDDDDDVLSLGSLSLTHIGIAAAVVLVVCFLIFYCVGTGWKRNENKIKHTSYQQGVKSVELTDIDRMYPSHQDFGSDFYQDEVPPAMAFDRLSSFANFSEVKKQYSSSKMNAVMTNKQIKPKTYGVTPPTDTVSSKTEATLEPHQATPKQEVATQDATTSLKHKDIAFSVL